MTVTLDLTAETIARLEAEASRRGVAVETVINELAEGLPRTTESAADARQA